MRYSKQRETVYNAVAATKSHPSADWVYGRVREIIPAISLGTVYRNLKSLCDSGRLVTLETSLGSIHYDADISEHVHFVCERCGKIIDVGVMTADHGQLEQQGYSVTSEKRVFYGVCKDCNK